jgi:hypothetical protein
MDGIVKYPRFTGIFIFTIITRMLIIGSVLQINKLGLVAMASVGPYHPIYLLGPYRLAAVAAGSFTSVFWTIVPYHITTCSVLRKNLGHGLFLLATFYSRIHPAVELWRVGLPVHLLSGWGILKALRAFGSSGVEWVDHQPPSRLFSPITRRCFHSACPRDSRHIARGGGRVLKGRTRLGGRNWQNEWVRGNKNVLSAKSGLSQRKGGLYLSEYRSYTFDSRLDVSSAYSFAATGPSYLRIAWTNHQNVVSATTPTRITLL